MQFLSQPEENGSAVAKLFHLSLYLHMQDKTQLVSIYRLADLHLFTGNTFLSLGCKASRRAVLSFLHGRKIPIAGCKGKAPKIRV